MGYRASGQEKLYHQPHYCPGNPVFIGKIEWCRVLVDQSTQSGFISSLGMWCQVCQHKLAVGHGKQFLAVDIGSV